MSENICFGLFTFDFYVPSGYQLLRMLFVSGHALKFEIFSSKSFVIPAILSF